MYTRFDELARSLAGSLSRREALWQLGRGLTGALLASLGLAKTSVAPAAADAPPTREACLALCGRDYGFCARGCDDRLRSAFLRAAEALQACRAGCPTQVQAAEACLRACLAAYVQRTRAAGEVHTRCHVNCAINQGDCWRACGNACPAGTTLCTSISGADCCRAGETCCNGRCVDVRTHPENCGGCFRPCDSGDPTCCNGNCTDLHSDNNNCGACGRVCAAGLICAGGLCVPPCASQTCGSLTPGCGGNSNCFCYEQREFDRGACGAEVRCEGTPTCISSSDCPSGSFCATNTCCNPSGICIPTCTASTGPTGPLIGPTSVHP